MPRKIRISFAASAVADLESIRTYYAEQGVPHVAARLLSELISRIEGLSDHPDIGRKVPEFDMEHLRELIHPPFRIFIGATMTRYVLCACGGARDY